jgi:uncharacterized Zn-finger protein
MYSGRPSSNMAWNQLPMTNGAVAARPVVRAQSVSLSTNNHGVVSISADLDTHASRAQPTLMEVNNVVRKVFVCPVPNCGRALTTRFNYKRHTKRHTGEKQFQCEYAGCGKRFAEKSSMKRHFKVHERKRDKRTTNTGSGRKPGSPDGSDGYSTSPTTSPSAPHSNGAL